MTGDGQARGRAGGRVVWSAPGRVNLIGEHTDYNDGFVLPFAMEARTRVSAERRHTDEVVVRSAQASGCGRVAIEDLDPSRSTGSWVDYVFGVVWALAELTEISGLELSVDGAVPLGSGLSSSAALECAVAGAIDELYSAGLSRVELARACRKAENEYVGVPCGPMDQAASLLCLEGSALFLDTRSLEARHVTLAPADSGCVLLLVDTGVRHELAASAYGERRRDCERAAGRLGVRSLREVSPEQLHAALGELDDPRLARRVRHVVSENARVLEAARLLEGGRLREVGELLTQSHRSLRDDYEVSCPELDLAVDAALAAGALGARLTGGGFGGFAIALADEGREQAIRAQVDDAFRDRGRAGPSIQVTQPSAGARSETAVSACARAPADSRPTASR